MILFRREKKRFLLISIFYLQKRKNAEIIGIIMIVAETRGFEPRLGVNPLAVFKTTPFSHLGKSPCMLAFIRQTYFTRFCPLVQLPLVFRPVFPLVAKP